MKVVAEAGLIELGCEFDILGLIRPGSANFNSSRRLDPIWDDETYRCGLAGCSGFSVWRSD